MRAPIMMSSIAGLALCSLKICLASGRRQAPIPTLQRPALEWPRVGPVLLSVLRLRACAVAAFVRTRLLTAQAGRHLAIVDPLLVARLAAKALLGGAGRLDVARLVFRRRCCPRRGSRHPQD